MPQNSESVPSLLVPFLVSPIRTFQSLGLPPRCYIHQGGVVPQGGIVHLRSPHVLDRAAVVTWADPSLSALFGKASSVKAPSSAAQTERFPDSPRASGSAKGSSPSRKWFCYGSSSFLSAVAFLL